MPMVHWDTGVPAHPDFFTCHLCGQPTGRIIAKLPDGTLEVEWSPESHVCTPRQLRDAANKPW